ncbi:hypothetical protein YC2023_007974 [Brassica napus]
MVWEFVSGLCLSKSSLLGREVANQWYKPSYREEEGSQGRTLHYDYGVRRDLYHRSETLRAKEVDSHMRLPARERLSGSRNDNSAPQRPFTCLYFEICRLTNLTPRDITKGNLTFREGENIKEKQMADYDTHRNE